VYDCVLCPTKVVEDWQHLFFSCNFSQKIWKFFWGHGTTVEGIVLTARKDFAKPFFFEEVILAC
jgi:hypothetical protein